MASHLVICFCMFAATLSLPAGRLPDLDLSGRWSASPRESVGPPSLGGTVEIHQESTRLSITRRVSATGSVVWSCEIGGAECRNQNGPGGLVTKSRVYAGEKDVTILTYGVRADNTPVRVRRVLSIDSLGRLIVVTSVGDRTTDESQKTFTCSTAQFRAESNWVEAH
jgi:hypothetical protein